MPRSSRKSILFFCTATFFYWTALYLYVPVLPVYAQSMGDSLPMVGAVISSYAIAQLLLRIPIGVWSDAVGMRKPLVAGGIVMVSVGALGLGLAPNPWLLLLARAVIGIGAAAWVAFPVFLASYYPREQAARAIGLISFVNAAGLVVATSFGGAIVHVWGFGHVFFGAALLGIVALVVLLPAREPSIQRVHNLSWNGFFRVATHPLLLTVSLITVLFQFVQFSSIFGFTPVYADKIGASRADLGIITMLALGSAAVAALGAIYMAERWGYPLTIMVGALFLGIALAATPFIQQVYLLQVAQVGVGLGRGLLITTLMALSIRGVAPEQRATAMGFFQAMYAIGMLAGPLASGFLAESLELPSVFYLSAALCLVIAGMALLPILRRG